MTAGAITQVYTLNIPTTLWSWTPLIDYESRLRWTFLQSVASRTVFWLLTSAKKFPSSPLCWSRTSQIERVESYRYLGTWSQTYLPIKQWKLFLLVSAAPFFLEEAPWTSGSATIVFYPQARDTDHSYSGPTEPWQVLCPHPLETWMVDTFIHQGVCPCMRICDLSFHC